MRPNRLKHHGPDSQMEDATAPGFTAMAQARDHSSPASPARHSSISRAAMVMASLESQYALEKFAGCSLDQNAVPKWCSTELRKIIRPREARTRGRRARISLKWPRKFTPIVESRPRPVPCRLRAPALATMTSHPENSFVNVWMNLSTEVIEETSKSSTSGRTRRQSRRGRSWASDQIRSRAASARDLLRHAMITRAPIFTSPAATRSPIPDDAPVMMQIRPRKSRISNTGALVTPRATSRVKVMWESRNQGTAKRRPSTA
mmetsp:Transcript_2891/g.8227  ORF Transcript_2891/g.8227 Transcript_2891/m.8227 type:complete len:261 (-) Transcript_2891:52-834(-)